VFMMPRDESQQLLLPETFSLCVCLTCQKLLLLRIHVGSALSIQQSLDNSTSN